MDILRPSTRPLRGRLRMRYPVDGIEKNLVVRKPLSGCLEGREEPVPAARGKIHRL
jgi:hypothetical protein